MSVADKLQVQCPQCGKGLSVPASAAGKSARCPMCQLVFKLPDMAAAPQQPQYYPQQQPQYYPPQPFAAPAPLAGQNPYAADSPNYQLQPLANQGSPLAPQADSNGLPVVNPYAPSAAGSAASPSKYNHGFGMEQRGWDAGMIGGLIMMAIGAAWFFGGLAMGYIFFYAPILFVIGLVGFVRGLFTGNVSGR